MHSDYRLFISDSGEQALLVVNRTRLYLWEVEEGTGMPLWWKIDPPEEVLLPQTANRKASVDACFHVHPVSCSSWCVHITT